MKYDMHGVASAGPRHNSMQARISSGGAFRTRLTAPGRVEAYCVVSECRDGRVRIWRFGNRNMTDNIAMVGVCIVL